MTINIKIQFSKLALRLLTPDGVYHTLVFAPMDEAQAAALLPQYGYRREWLVATERLATTHLLGLDAEQLMGCVWQRYCRELDAVGGKDRWLHGRRLTTGLVAQWLQQTLPQLLPTGTEQCRLPKEFVEEVTEMIKKN